MAIKDVILGYAKGDKGDRGPQGEKGATGATGPKGEPGNIADAQITDTEGLDVAKGQKTTAQKLFDAIANRIVTKLVTNDALTKKLADYMLKGMMSNTNVNNTGTVPTSALMYSMFEQINSDFQYKELTNEFDLNKALGKYRTDSSVIITSLKNKPSEIRNAGETTLDWYPANERNTYGIQIMRWTFGNTHMIFTRNKTENTWAKWVQCATKSDLDKGQFVVKVEENIQKVITSQSDIVRGTLPSQMKDCAYAAIGFSTTIDNELSIVVDGNSIIVSPKKTNNAVTINWFQFN